MKKTRIIRTVLNELVIFALILSITSCSYLPKKTTEQTTDASIEQSTTEEPTTSETLDLSGYYFMKHPIQEESGAYESRNVDIDIENELFQSGLGVLTYNDFFCFLTCDLKTYEKDILHEFDYEGNPICATELPCTVGGIAKSSETSAILQGYVIDDETDFKIEYYEFDFKDHSVRKLEQFDRIDGTLLDYENDKAFFQVGNHIECYDNTGKQLYQTGSLSDSNGYSSDWYVIDGTVYAKFYDKKITNSYRLMKYDESGERVYNEEFPMAGLEVISSLNDIVSMADLEGCWILNEDSFTWSRVLAWQNKETSLVTDSVQTAVSSDMEHVLIWNNLSTELYLLVKTDGNVEDNSIVLAGYHDALTYTRRYDEFSWDEEPYPIIYDDVYVKDYLDAKGNKRPDYEIEDELINDFKNGDIDVLFLTDLTHETMNYDPTTTLRKIKLLEFDGYCMDMSQFIAPYVNGSKEWLHPIPVSLYSKYASSKGLFTIPAGLPRVEGLYAKKNIKLGAEDSYAEWLEYANTKASDKPFLYYSPAGWVTQCLDYDLDAFIDYDTNQAHFDCQEFQDILVMAAQHTGFDTVLTNATKPLSTAYLSNRYIFDRLESDISDLKKVGVPSISGTGLYMNSDVIILVSSQCKNPQLAWKVIECYLDWCKEYAEYPKWSKTDGEMLQDVNLVINPDPQILDIVYQETDAYFYDNQSFEKTAAAINERVNELLKERN